MNANQQINTTNVYLCRINDQELALIGAGNVLVFNIENRFLVLALDTAELPPGYDNLPQLRGSADKRASE